MSSRTVLINSVRGPGEVPGEDDCHGRNPGYFHTLGTELPEALREILEPTMAGIAQLNEQIRAYDRQSGKLIEDKYPKAAHLCKIGGVGPITGAHLRADRGRTGAILVRGCHPQGCSEA